MTLCEELNRLLRECKAQPDHTLGYLDAREDYFRALADAHEDGHLVTREELDAAVEAAIEADRAEFNCEDCDLPGYICEARGFVRNSIKVHGEAKTWEALQEYFPTAAIRAREGGKA